MPFSDLGLSDEDSEDSDAEEETAAGSRKLPAAYASPSNPKARRVSSSAAKTDLQWRTVWEGASLEDAKQFLTQSGKEQCSGLQWTRDGKEEKGLKYGVSMFTCAFKKDSACKYKCKIIRNLATGGACEVQESKGVAHADHRIKLTRSGPHKLIKAEFVKSGSNLMHAPSRDRRIQRQWS